MIQKVTTLNQFIIEQQAAFPNATGDFSRLLHHVGIAAKKVNREVNKAGLVDILGQAGTENVQGEDQQKLAVYADITFINELRASGECCSVLSEENQDIIVFKDGMCRNAKYIFCMDPLDGSSNIDVNVSSGTIFSVYRRKSAPGEEVGQQDFLQKGRAGSSGVCHLRFFYDVGLYCRKWGKRFYAGSFHWGILPFSPAYFNSFSGKDLFRQRRLLCEFSGWGQEIYQILSGKR